MDVRINRKITLPLVVDIGMVIALATLCFWVGKQADRIDNVSAQMLSIQSQIIAVTANNSAADIAALKERALAQDRQLVDMKDYLGRRLDRLESKIDGRR